MAAAPVAWAPECSRRKLCQPLQYALANGLGNYVLAGSSLVTSSDAFTCTLTSPTFSCDKPAIAAASNLTLTFTGTETGNASTPGKSVTDTSKTLNATPEMTFTGTPASPFADGVAGRTYGQGSTCGTGSTPCAPLTYTIQTGSGLGGYTYALSPSIGFACTSGAATSNCTSAAVTGGANTYATVHTSVTDAANASTPSNTITSSNGSLTVHLEMSVTPPAAVATAVHGRAFGTGAGCSGGACQPLQYTLSSGLGNYTLTGSSLTTPSDTFACTLASPTFSCSDATITGAGGTNPALTFTGAETGNGSTPAHAVTDTSKILNTNGAMTVTAPAVVPPAVQGRAYGTGVGCSGGACLPLQYALANGLGNYTLAGSSLATTADTFACGFASPTFSCDKAAIAASTNLPLTFTGTETGNVSTPRRHRHRQLQDLERQPGVELYRHSLQSFCRCGGGANLRRWQHLRRGWGHGLHSVDLHDSDRERPGRLFVRIFTGHQLCLFGRRGHEQLHFRGCDGRRQQLRDCPCFRNRHGQRLDAEQHHCFFQRLPDGPCGVKLHGDAAQSLCRCRGHTDLWLGQHLRCRWGHALHTACL